MSTIEGLPREVFPSGKERRDLLAANEEKIVELRKLGEKGFRFKESDKEYLHYGWLDSPLDGTGNGSFLKTFRDVLPSGAGSMRKYIEQTLRERKGDAIGIEFGGIGSRAFEGFTENFFKKSIGVTLVDHDKGVSDFYAYRTKEDSGRNHNIIEGDIFSEDTYAALETELRGQQADFIIERMAKGLEAVPREPYFIGKFISIWYRLLRENGVLFAQVPVALNPLLHPWIDKIRADYSGVLEVASAEGRGDIGGDTASAFRLRKLPGAPKELPLLDPRAVRAISRG